VLLAWAQEVYAVKAAYNEYGVLEQEARYERQAGQNFPKEVALEGLEGDGCMAM
jgi:hypothetical protein